MVDHKSIIFPWRVGVYSKYTQITIISISCASTTIYNTFTVVLMYVYGIKIPQILKYLENFVFILKKKTPPYKIVRAVLSYIHYVYNVCTVQAIIK